MSRRQMERGRHMLRRTLGSFVVGMLVCAAVPLQSQGTTKCTTPSDGVSYVSDVAMIFSDSSFAAIRAAIGLDTLATRDAREVITDERVCGSLTIAAKAAFRKMFSPPRPSLSDNDVYFFRMGKYYAVMILPKVPPGMAMNGSSPTMIFSSTFDYLGRVDW